MTPGIPPDHDECIEQAYFFRTFRERIGANIPAQETLARLHEELLSSTKMPFAVQFLSLELKHSGRLSDGFAKLPHYFTPFQTFVMRQADSETSKFTTLVGLQILEREAEYKADQPSPSGLFVYQFETICRNRLGYDYGLDAVGGDPFYDGEWKKFAELVRRQVGIIDFADLIYLRSELYVAEQRRRDADYVPSLPPLFAEREGKIAKASLGRDPLFLFAALQRQLNYPEVPRARPREDIAAKFDVYEVKFREMDSRIRMLESESRGTFDPTQLGKPEILKDLPEVE